MMRFSRYLLLLALLPGIAISQIRVVKPVKSPDKSANIGLGIGGASSVLYLARNINSSNDAHGFNATISYDKGNYLRGSLDYTYYSAIDIKPTWFDVRAQTIEANISFISKSKNKIFYFYPIAGVSYNIFKGYFTGVNDYLNLSSIYQKNETVKTAWVGMNAGVGMDINFRRGAFYWNFKMRLGKTEGFGQFNIMDVYNAVGLRYYIKAASIHKLFRGTRSRYQLSKKEPAR